MDIAADRIMPLAFFARMASQRESCAHLPFLLLFLSSALLAMSETSRLAVELAYRCW